MAPRRRRRRLSRSGEFERAYREGSSHATRHLVVYAFPRAQDDDSEPRLGVSVGRKVGGAVERNRMKRLLREAFWSLEELPPTHDYVIVARPGAKGFAEARGIEGLREELRSLVVQLVGPGAPTRDER
jgi:ribonuclease P protein component